MQSESPTAVVYYVRHGENRANLTREFSYRVVDYPLTSKGLEQAHAVAQRLVAEGVTAAPVFTSPMRRATQTAQIIADALGITTQELEDFREVNVGSLDGKSDAESWKIYNAVTDDWFEGRNSSHSFPGGEDRLGALVRFKNGLRHVIDSKPTGPAVVVGHGGLLVGTLSALCPSVRMPTENLLNCGVAKLSFMLHGDELVGHLHEWNNESH